MTLREAIDRFCRNDERRTMNDENAENGMRNAEGENERNASLSPTPYPLPPWKIWTCDVVEIWRRCRGRLGGREAALGMKETCEKTIPLLKEMLEKQADAAEMNRLFVEVDRLRGKVGQDSATFEMVAFLNTIGEMRKFQADLGVKTSKKDSLERQRRQLMRDVEYVGDLQVGCERLLEIVEEARIERQLAAARGRGCLGRGKWRVVEYA